MLLRCYGFALNSVINSIIMLHCFYGIKALVTFVWIFNQICFRYIHPIIIELCSGGRRSCTWLLRLAYTYCAPISLWAKINSVDLCLHRTVVALRHLEFGHCRASCNHRARVQDLRHSLLWPLQIPIRW